MPKLYSRVYRDDVVRVVRDRDRSVTLEEVAADFGTLVWALSK